MLTKDSKAHVAIADRPPCMSPGSGESECAEESIPLPMVVEVRWSTVRVKGVLSSGLRASGWTHSPPARVVEDVTMKK